MTGSARAAAGAVDRYEEVYSAFRWQVPARFNMGWDCCGQWAADRNRFALYWEDESGATAAYTFWDIQQRANQLSNALAALGEAIAGQLHGNNHTLPPVVFEQRPYFGSGGRSINTVNQQEGWQSRCQVLRR